MTLRVRIVPIAQRQAAPVVDAPGQSVYRGARAPVWCSMGSRADRWTEARSSVLVPHLGVSQQARVLRGRCNSEPAVTVRDPLTASHRWSR
jgi:hypothetical protein